jgi:hypothetical protein
MLRSACSSNVAMGGTPLRREYRTLMAGTGGSERSRRGGGTMVDSRASLRLRLPWSCTGRRRRMVERAAVVGSIFLVDFLFCFGSSGSRQMLERKSKS